MTIKVGDKLPQATFRVMTADGPAARTTDDLFAGKKVVLFAEPGAFTPTCHRNHLPGFLEKAAEIKAKGLPPADVDRVVRLLRINEYKRRQAPVGPRVTPRAYGRDWRYPITSGWRE